MFIVFELEQKYHFQILKKKNNQQTIYRRKIKFSLKLYYISIIVHNLCIIFILQLGFAEVIFFNMVKRKIYYIGK